jgi:cytochrome c-type biogenesis protein CcmE
MSQLDDDLSQALAEAEDPPAPEPGRRSGPPATDGDARGAARRKLGLVVALVAMGAAIVALVVTSFRSAAVYSKGVDELVAEREALSDRHVRVDGILVSGSLRRRDEPCEYRFALEKNGSRIDIRYPQCVVPDTLRDYPGVAVEVTAEGRLAGEGYFEADQILAKCPSKYEMNERAGQGKQAPHRPARPLALPKQGTTGSERSRAN